MTTLTSKHWNCTYFWIELKISVENPNESLVTITSLGKDYDESVNFRTVVFFGLIHPDSWMVQTNIHNSNVYHLDNWADWVGNWRLAQKCWGNASITCLNIMLSDLFLLTLVMVLISRDINSFLQQTHFKRKSSKQLHLSKWTPSTFIIEIKMRMFVIGKSNPWPWHC